MWVDMESGSGAAEQALFLRVGAIQAHHHGRSNACRRPRAAEIEATAVECDAHAINGGGIAHVQGDCQQRSRVQHVRRQDLRLPTNADSHAHPAIVGKAGAEHRDGRATSIRTA